MCTNKSFEFSFKCLQCTYIKYTHVSNAYLVLQQCSGRFQPVLIVFIGHSLGEETFFSVVVGSCIFCSSGM